MSSVEESSGNGSVSLYLGLVNLTMSYKYRKHCKAQVCHIGVHGRSGIKFLTSNPENCNVEPGFRAPRELPSKLVWLIWSPSVEYWVPLKRPQRVDLR